jgi:zinc protease
MTVRASLALALVLAAAPAGAQDVPEIPFTRYVLGNGLTLVVHEDHKAPIVAVNVWYHVGSKNEKPGRTGFAHLFEHLMFQPSEHMKGDVLKTLEAVGATDLNGTTDQDRTNYFENVPVSALDTALFVESDRMGHLVGAIDQKKLDLQRGVVQNEKRQGENEPYGLVDEVLQPVLYPRGHPYSWTVIGSMTDLNAASLDDVKEWFKTWYGPSNATLVVAGDVSPEDVKARVERYFGHIPPGPPVERPVAWVARRSGEQRLELQDRVPQARVYLAWNTPPWGTQDDTALHLAGQVLSSGKSSRLFKRLVYDEQLALDVTASQGTAELGSNFVIVATARPGGDPAAVEKVIKEEVARLAEKGPTADELARARTARLAGFIRGVERIGGWGGKSDVLAQGQVYGGDPASYRRTTGWLRAATPALVQEAARRWLGDGIAVLTVRPFPELEAFTPDVDRRTLPVPGPQADARFPAIRRATLGNGLQLVVVERHAVPVVTFDLLVDAGYASDAGRAAGTAKLASGMLDEGTATRSSIQISDELQRLGATLSTGSNLDQSQVSLSALKANLDASLAIYADVVLHPSFPRADFERLQRQQLAAIEQEQAEPQGVALRLVPGLIFGAGHPYGNPLTGSGTTAAVKQLTRDDMVRWWSTWFKPNAATLLVVGDTTLDEVKPKLERAFSRWARGEVPRKTIGAGAPAAPGIYLVDRPGAQQSLILMGTLAPPRNNPRAIEQEVMNNILGGLFSARVNMNLREDKHWSYGAYTFMLPARGPRPYLGTAPVQTDKTSEALAEFIREVKGIRGERPATSAELGGAQSALTLALPGEWETARAVAHSTAEILRFGLDDRYWDGYAAAVRAVDLGAVTEAAQILDPARIVWVVVGDRAKVEAGLKGLGLGAPRLIDGEGRPVAGK